MTRHATSHGLAVLVCTITSGMLAKLGREYYPHLVDTCSRFINIIVATMNIDYPPRAALHLVTACFLAVVWGLAFSFLHED